MIIFGKERIVGFINVEHWVLWEYESRVFCFLEKIQSINIFVIFMFLSYFHNRIKVLNLDLSRYEWKEFISISFMICFSPDLD